MNMKTKHLMIYVLLALLVPAACSEEPAAEPPAPPVETDVVKVENKQITLTSDGGTADIMFESSGAWAATVDSKAAGWCKLDRSSGDAGTGTLRVTVLRNTSYDERNAAIYITCGRARDVVTITQKQLNAITLTTNKVELDAEGGDFQLQIKASTDVSYEIDADAQAWIEPADTRGTRALVQSTLGFRARPNSTFTPRQGGIVIRDDSGLEERVTVYQAGQVPTLVLNSRDRLVVDSEGETLQLEVQSNVDYALELPAVDWISENRTRSVSSYTHYLSILPNPAYDPREAQLVVRSADGTLADTVTIYQMQKGAIVVAKDSYDVSGEQSILKLRLSTSVDIETRISVPWITPYTAAKTRALEERELLFNVGKNPTGEARTGEIAFCYKDLEQRVTVRQAGRNDYMRLQIVHSETTFAPLVLWGSHFQGAIQWGDGTTTDLFQGHTFASPAERTTTVDALGIDSLRIERLGTISSLTIYCDEWEEE